MQQYLKQYKNAKYPKVNIGTFLQRASYAKASKPNAQKAKAEKVKKAKAKGYVSQSNMTKLQHIQKDYGPFFLNMNLSELLKKKDHIKKYVQNYAEYDNKYPFPKAINSFPKYLKVIQGIDVSKRKRKSR